MRETTANLTLWIVDLNRTNTSELCRAYTSRSFHYGCLMQAIYIHNLERYQCMKC